MHIGHSPCTDYLIYDDDGNSSAIEQITGKDLGVYIATDLKSSMHCVRSAAKARSVIGMVRRNFKRLNKEDILLIYKMYIQPRMQYCVQA